MNAEELKQLHLIHDHVAWLEKSVKQAKEASKLIAEDGELHVKVGPIDMILHHTDHRLILVTGFNELAKELQSELSDIEIELG